MVVFGLVLGVFIAISILKMIKDHQWDGVDFFCFVVFGILAGLIVSVIGGSIVEPEPIEEIEVTPIIIDDGVYFKENNTVIGYDNGRVCLTDKDYMYIDYKKYDASTWLIFDRRVLMIPKKAVEDYGQGKNG